MIRVLRVIAGMGVGAEEIPAKMVGHGVGRSTRVTEPAACTSKGGFRIAIDTR